MRKLKRLFLIIQPIILMLMAVDASAAKKNEKYLFFTSQYPPYHMSTDGSQFAHDKSNITGICTEIVKSLLDKANFNYQIRLRIWSHGYERVQRNENNGIFCMVKNKERESLFRWVGPIMNMEWSLFATSDSKITLKNLKQAKQYRIGGAKNDVISNYLTDNGFNISVIFNDIKNPVRLKSGSIDLWASDSATGPYLAADEADISDIKNVLTFNSTPMYIGMSLDVDSAVIDKLNQILKEMHQSGEIHAIKRSYGL